MRTTSRLVLCALALSLGAGSTTTFAAAESVAPTVALRRAEATAVEAPNLDDAFARSGAVDLSWSSAPGGDPVTAYRVYADGAWVATIGDDEPLARRWTVTGLHDGTPVNFQVTERRGGTWSSPSAPRAAIPSPPSGLRGVPADAAPAVDWSTAPGTDPGRPLVILDGGWFAPRRVVTRGGAARLGDRYAGRPGVSPAPPPPAGDVPAGLADAVRWVTTDPDGAGPGGPLLAIDRRGRFHPRRFLDRGDLARLVHGLAGRPDAPRVAAGPDVPPSLVGAVSWGLAVGALPRRVWGRYLPTLPTDRVSTIRALHRVETWRAEQAVTRLPADRWAPDLGPDGNVVVVESERGDPAGNGVSGTYTAANARLAVTGDGDRLSLTVDGDVFLRASLRFPETADPHRIGFFDPIRRTSAATATRFGLLADDGSLDSACFHVEGWVAVDHIRWAPDGSLAELEARFEQRCGDVTAPEPALRVAVRYDAALPVYDPAGPSPITDDLWAPAAGDVPATGNWVRIDSDGGDGVTSGRHQVYTADDSVLSFATTGEEVDVSVRSTENWVLSARFPTASTIRPGRYDTFLPNGHRNPTVPYLHFHALSHVCSRTVGWAAVDAVVVDDSGVLQRLDLRFEQHCNGDDRPPLLGALHYDATEPVFSPRRPEPIPADLWQPSGPISPPAGSWAWFEPAVAPTNPLTSMTLSGSDSISASGLAVYPSSWIVRVSSPTGVLEEGWYRDANRDPTRGGLSFERTGMSQCRDGDGWFAVDHLVRDAQRRISELDLRFEFQCHSNAQPPPQRGLVHYRRAG